MKNNGCTNPAKIFFLFRFGLILSGPFNLCLTLALTFWVMMMMQYVCQKTATKSRGVKFPMNEKCAKFFDVLAKEQNNCKMRDDAQ